MGREKPIIILYAPRIHVGGGLVLLREILAAGDNRFALVSDSRAELDLTKVEHSVFVRPGVSSYLMGEMALRRITKRFPDADVLCLSSLAPLTRLKNRTFVFVQNRFVVDHVPGLQHPMKTRLRLALERFLWRFSRANANEFLVQSSSMAAKVMEIAPSSKVRILPFLDTVGFARTTNESLGKDLDFVYVATPDAHKNHARLLQAWETLAVQGFRPSLGLTLDSDHEVWRQAESVNRRAGTKIVRIEGSRESFYDRAKALIFPSQFETLGLPLLEAANRGLPILASELDFVRDSVVPDQTFDPSSSVSIARAVRRWMGKPEPTRVPMTAVDFLNHLKEIRS